MDKSLIILSALIAATVVFFVIIQKQQHVHSESCCHGHMHSLLNV